MIAVPKFTIKDLLIATASIAVGLAAIAAAARRGRQAYGLEFLNVLLIAYGVILIWIGGRYPFTKVEVRDLLVGLIFAGALIGAAFLAASTLY